MTGTNASRPLLAWLGDDFTGAAAVMEVLAFAGLPSVLFLSPPSAERLAAFGPLAGIGIASMARTQIPEWMDAELPGLFETLDQTGAVFVQYKTCSTLDSAPHIGSIGRAMEIGQRRFGGAIPILIAAPEMRRYQAFGHLFAGTDEGVFRLDRHPVMARHPVTPMNEADVARHLAAQTDIPIGCINHEALPGATADQPPGTAFTIDQITKGDVAAAGRLLWDGRAQNRFVVGSQGIAYALVAHLRETGTLTAAPQTYGIGPARRMAVVSGSVSPITGAQIDWACANGFAGIALDVAPYCNGEETAPEAEEAAISSALTALDKGQTPLIHSARGPDDPAVALVREGAAPGTMDRIGQALGRILAALVSRGELDRAVVSGGDTSGHVCTALGIEALTAVAPTIPGAAICRAHRTDGQDGLTIALKGGQMGSRDYFGWVRDGGGAR